MKPFNAELKAKLDAAGFTALEQQHGALMAEMRAAANLCSPPLAAFTCTNVFAKTMATLSERDNVSPERTCDASNLIYDTVMAHAREVVGAARGNREPIAGANSQNSQEVPTVMVEGIDDSPATDDKQINEEEGTAGSAFERCTVCQPMEEICEPLLRHHER